MFEGNLNNLGMLSNKIETTIETNPEQAAKQLPQGSPIQQEAKQLTDNNPHNNEVNNKIVDDYVNTINENFGEGIKYLKPNYETLKNMPFGIDKQDELVNSDWWKEQNARNIMFDDPKTKNFINLQPGFDYNYDAIKADYPEAYYKGESPEELRQKQRQAVTEDFVDTGDVGVLEEYIKLTGDVPWTDDAGYVMDDDNLWNMHEAIARKYPQFFERKSFRGDIDELAQYLRNKENNVEADEIDPVTAAMNEGLSEDDRDYFGYNERIEKPIAKTGRRINA